MAKQQQKYFIGPSLLSDIRRTITRVDAIAPKTSGAAQPVRLQELQRPASKLRRGTFTGSWAIGSTAAVTIEGTTQTAEVTNYCAPVDNDAASTQAFNVIFGSVMGTQTAIEIQQQASGIRAATFTGSWNINSLKAVTLQGVTTTPNTVMATNQLFTIGDACTTQVAYIGKVSSLAPAGATADWHLLSVQHHETALVVSVTLTTAALEFTRRLAWIPYPGETSTFSIPLTTDTACSS